MESDSLRLNPDRLFPTAPSVRSIARTLYQEVCNLPIVSPHGHTDPSWFSCNQPFDNPSATIIKPDHYLFRMLYSLGVPLAQLGIGPATDPLFEKDPLAIWRSFAAHYYAFRGTPTQMWLDYVFSEIFGLTQKLNADTADDYYHTINDLLKTDAFRPRALFERFNIEVLATTESALDSLSFHQSLQKEHWKGRVITTFRPDDVIDPDFEGFAENLIRLGEVSGEDVTSYGGYLKAIMVRRQFFIAHGATASDHGHPTAFTADLNKEDAQKLYQKIFSGQASAQEKECFRGQMLTEMAKMSLEDGLVMQLHPGVARNHNKTLFEVYGRDMGADIPVATNYVDALRPLLNSVGNNPNLTFIVFTLDESAYSRELAPLAGHYPAMKLGPAWWFHDSPEGIMRFRARMTETAGFYNTVGFNDDTRAFFSIPARHDMARRLDSAFLAKLVAEHRLTLTEASELAIELSYRLAKRAYKL